MIRPARHTDLDALVGLLQMLFSIEEDFCFDAEKHFKGLVMLLQKDEAAVLVAEENGEVVGMISGQCLISTAEGGRAVLVEDLVVKPEWQRKGTGSNLVLAIGDWANKKGARRLQLLADSENNTALSFYNTMAWQRTRLICLRKYHGEKQS